MSTLSSFLSKPEKVVINEGVKLLKDELVVVVDGQTFLRSGVTSTSATYPLAANVAGVVGSTVYVPNLYFRVA